MFDMALRTPMGWLLTNRAQALCLLIAITLSVFASGGSPGLYMVAGVVLVIALVLNLLAMRRERRAS